MWIFSGRKKEADDPEKENKKESKELKSAPTEGAGDESRTSPEEGEAAKQEEKELSPDSNKDKERESSNASSNKSPQQATASIHYPRLKRAGFEKGTGISFDGFKKPGGTGSLTGSSSTSRSVLALEESQKHQSTESEQNGGRKKSLPQLNRPY